MPSSRGFSQPRDQTQVSCIAGGFFIHWATQEACTQGILHVNYEKLGMCVSNWDNIRSLSAWLFCKCNFSVNWRHIWKNRSSCSFLNCGEPQKSSPWVYNWVSGDLAQWVRHGVEECRTAELGFFLSLWLSFYFLIFILFIYWPYPTAYGSWVSWPGIEPKPPALEVQGLNHWTATEVFAAVLLWRDGYSHLK